MTTERPQRRAPKQFARRFRLERHTWFGLRQPDRDEVVRVDALANVVVRNEEGLPMTTVLGPLPPVVGFVRGLDGDFFLCSEVAEALGVSTATLRRLSLSKPEVFAPSSSTWFGKMLVPLYAIGDVDRLHEHVEAKAAAARSGSARCPGRPRIWTDAERRSRRARYCAAAYRTRRARELADAGEYLASAASSQAAATIRASLRDEYGRARLARQAAPDWPKPSSSSSDEQ